MSNRSPPNRRTITDESIFIQDGYINVYLNNKPEPFISGYDPSPVHVKYVSFASFQTSQVEFLYNCVSDKSVDPEPAQSTSAPPTDDSDLSEAPLDGN